MAALTLERYVQSVAQYGAMPHGKVSSEPCRTCACGNDVDVSAHVLRTIRVLTT